MPITLKKDVWKVKDPSSGQYRGAAILSTTLPQDAAQIISESNDTIQNIKDTAIEAVDTALNDESTGLIPKAEADRDAIDDSLNNASNGIIPTAQSDRDDIDDSLNNINDGIIPEAQANLATIAAAVQSQISQGTDKTLSVAKGFADAKAAGMMVKVSNYQPGSQLDDPRTSQDASQNTGYPVYKDSNRVWVKETYAELEVPTMDDHNDLKSALNASKEATLSFTTTNLLNPQNIVEGYIIRNNGTVSNPVSGYSYLDWTPVNTNVLYATAQLSANTGKCACYDGNKAFLGCPDYNPQNGIVRLELFKNTAFIRWTLQDSAISTFKILPFFWTDKSVGFGEYVQREDFVKQTDYTADMQEINDSLLTLGEENERIAGFAETANVISPWDFTSDDITIGYYDMTTGKYISQSVNYKCTKKFYPCSDGVRFIKSTPVTMLVCCYDKNKTFLGSLSSDSFLNSIFSPCTKNGTCFVTFTFGNTIALPVTVSIYNPPKYRCIASDIPTEMLVYNNRYMLSNGSLSINNDYKFFICPTKGIKSIWHSRIDNSVIPMIFLGDSGVINAIGTEEGVSGTRYPVPVDAKLVAINWQNNADSGVTSYNYNFIAFEYEKDDYSILSGKKILCIGDSKTYLDGRASVNAGTDCMIGYQSYLRACGATVESSSHNGQPYTNYSGGTSIYEAIVTNEYDVTGYDYIILFGGSNDSRLNVDKGVIGTYASPNINGNNFIGAVGGIINYIRNNNPMAKIILLTIAPDGNLHATTTGNGLELNIALRELALFWSVELIDTFALWNVSIGHLNTFVYDGTHPNYLGYRRLGELLARKLACVPVVVN